MKEFFERIGQAFSGNAAVTTLTIVLLFLLFFYLITLMERNNARWLVAVMAGYIALTGVLYMITDSSKKTRLHILYF